MELQELVERITRWKRRQAGEEDGESIHSVAEAVPMAVPYEPQIVEETHYEDTAGEITDEFEVDSEISNMAIPGMTQEQPVSTVDPAESALDSLPDEAEDELGGLPLSEYDETK